MKAEKRPQVKATSTHNLHRPAKSMGLAIICSMALAFLGGTAHGGVLLSDAFDGSISTDWTIEGADANSTATADGAESAFSAGSGSLRLDDNSSTAEVNLRYTMPSGQSIDEGESLTIEFDWYSVDASLPILQIQDGTANAGRVSLLGDFRHREGAAWTSLDTTVDGTWYRLSYTYHNDASDTADISLTPFGGSTTTWTGRPVENNKASINSILFAFNVNNTTLAKEWMIDNVTITESGSGSGSGMSPYFENLSANRVDSDTNLVWRQFGPGMSGNNYRIYWHPTDPNTVFLGPNMGITYRSTDKGNTYESGLDDDAQGYKFAERGPWEIGSPDFSRQNPDFGFCTKEDGTTLFTTSNKGRTWQPHTVSDAVWGGIELNAITVDPNNDQVWYVGSGNIHEYNKWSFTQANPHGVGAEANHVAKIWKTTNQGSNWTEITPAGIDPAAQIERILVHPGNSSVVFAATTYGFYKSTDGGATWALKGNGLDHNIIRSLDMHYNSGSGAVTLYVVDLVKWAANGNTVMNDGGGIFRSVDEGETWQNINGDISLDISVMAPLNYNFRFSYWGALNHWFGIADAQTQFTVYPSSLMHAVTGVRVDPNNPDKLFVLNDYKHWGGGATFKGGMLWRSDNGGTNWISTLRNGTAWEGDHQAYWASRGNPTSHNMTFRAQYEWQQRDPYERKAGAALEFNSDSSVIMFQWAKVLCTSTDGGDTWVESDEVEATPGTKNFVGSGDSNLPGHGLRQDARFPYDVFCPAGENDFWVTTDDGENVRPGAQAAHRISLGDGEFSCSDMVLHPNDTNTIYTLQFRQVNAGDLLKSTDGGQTFTVQSTGSPAVVYSPTPESESPIHQLCLTIDPDIPNNMYFCVPENSLRLGYVGDSIGGAFGVRKSTDGGVSWSWANSGLPTGTGGPDVACIRMDPNNSATLYACVYGSAGGLYVSTDRAATWTKLATFPANITSVLDLHFAVDGKMYASCGVSNGNWQDGGVWVSADGGATWSQIFESPWVRMTKTAVYDPNVVLVQMNSWNTHSIMNPGTFLSKDGGSSWTKINTNNPQSDRVNDIAIDQVYPNVYYVSTYGTGWYKASLATTNTVNQPPLFTSDPINKPNAVENAAYSSSIAGNAYDPESDPLTFSLVSGPAWLNVAANGALSGTPGAGDIGLNEFVVQVDATGGSDTAMLEITVDAEPVNLPPAFAADPVVEANGTEGQSYSGTIADDASDPESDPMTFSKVSGPAWLIVASNGDLSGTPGAGDVGLNSVTVQVDAVGGSDTATLEITVDAVGGPTVAYAQSESTSQGSVTAGSIADIVSNDNVYEVLTEAQSGGNPNNRRSWLDHTWTFNVAAGELVTFYVEAHHDANSEGDDFTFSYSTDNVNFTDMVTVTKTADDNTAQFYSLPGSLSGTVYVKVVDTDRTQGNGATDSLYVDALFIVSEAASVPPGAASNPGPSDGATGVSTTPVLTWTAGSLAASHDVYFGTNPTPGAGEFLGNQSGTSFSPGTLATSATYYWAVNEVNGAGTTVGPVWSFTTGTGTPEMHVASIVLGTQKSGKDYKGTATITIVESGSGQPVQGATVSGDFTGAFGESGSATTDASGSATITTTAKGSLPFSFTFTVTDVSEAGHVYNAANNVETSDSGSF